jgi:hypothetical protein
MAAPHPEVPAGLVLQGISKVTSFKRKIKRKIALRNSKYLKKNMSKIIEEAMKTKLSGIKKIPDNCDICGLQFDKNDREQVFSWMLKVDEDREVYNLICPDCYSKHYGDQDVALDGSTSDDE